MHRDSPFRVIQNKCKCMMIKDGPFIYCSTKLVSILTRGLNYHNFKKELSLQFKVGDGLKV